MRLTQQQAILVQLGLTAMALKLVGNKRRDYSGSVDPYRNLRMSEFVGVEPWRGSQVRNMDKFARRRSIMEAGGKAHVNESFLDTLADSINYIAIEGGLEIEELPDTQDMLEFLTIEAELLPSIVEEMLEATR